MSPIITRVATVALTLTGMSYSAARFQARSALTGAGFTTNESERVVQAIAQNMRRCPWREQMRVAPSKASS